MVCAVTMTASPPSRMPKRLILPALSVLVLLTAIGLGAWSVFGPVRKAPVELRLVRQWMYNHPRPQRNAALQVNERIDYEVHNRSDRAIEIQRIRLHGGPKPLAQGVTRSFYAMDPGKERWVKLEPGQTLKSWMIAHPTIERHNSDWNAYSLDLVAQWRYVNHPRDLFRDSPEVHDVRVPEVVIPPLSPATPEITAP
jgi:hypothetical protein